MPASRFVRCVAIVAVVGGFVGATAAHEGATGIVGERMEGMNMMSRALKALSETLAAPAPDPLVVRQAARTINDHAGTAMTSLFPEGSLDAPSVATDAIWNDWDEFSRLAVHLQDLGNDLALAGEGGPANGVVVAVPVAPRPQPESLWASLDERALLGLEPIVVPAANLEQAQLDSPPSVQETFVAITQACSDCHSKFRRQQK